MLLINWCDGAETKKLMSAINIRHLRAFTAVSEHQHFTHAADAIHISQPALSALIRQLETDLGVKLLDRNTRNVELTPIGREFYEIAQKTLATFDEALAHVADYGALRKGRVTVAALPSIASSILPRLVDEFTSRHSRIVVSVIDLPGDEVIEAVRSKRAEIGLTYTQPHPDIETHLIMRDRLILVGRLQHATARTGSIRWKSLGSEPIIAMARGTTIRALIDAAAAAAKTSLNIVLEPRLLPTALAFAEQGLGSAVVPSTITPLSTLKRCRQYELAAPAMSRDISSIHLAQSPLAPAARALHEHILVHFTRLKLQTAAVRKKPAR
jgi:LysR family transcriptional regulator, carnitine catabolism transcriptional activator